MYINLGINICFSGLGITNLDVETFYSKIQSPNPRNYLTSILLSPNQ